MTEDEEQLSYSYKPSLMGAPWVFRLSDDALLWEKGMRKGRVAYREITRVRMSFRPATLMFDRYRTEVWSTRTPRLEIISGSVKSVVEQQKQGPDYVTFVRELHRRLAQVPARFDTGSPVFLYWPAAAIFIGMGLAICALIIRALQTQTWSGAVVIAIFLAVFAYQAGTFFGRNLPGRYRPDDLPARLMPSAN